MQSSVCLPYFIITACAIVPKPERLKSTVALWRGRLAVRVDPDEFDRLGRSISAGFELTGNSTDGGLTLYTPIGGTAAVLAWSPADATLFSQSELQHFPSLSALIKQAVGTDLPVAALFAWVDGIDAGAEGWKVDLSNYANGKITAARTSTGPATELRIVLEH